MTHELEQFVYGLDVAEVGVEKANRRWEMEVTEGNWFSPWRGNDNDPGPSWVVNINYRRKPGLPMPKIPQATEWPVDAPKWARELVVMTEFRGDNIEQLIGYKTIPRPQPPKCKVDFSQLSPFVKGYWQGPVLNNNDDNPAWHFPSRWIPWHVPGCGAGCPVPAGLLLAVKYSGDDEGTPVIEYSEDVAWTHISAFRIMGISESLMDGSEE